MILAERKCSLLTPEEVALFEENFDELSKEYQDCGTLCLDSLVMVLGRPPVIPDTHDLDTRDMAYEEISLYSSKCMKIEDLLKTSLS